MPCTTPAWTRCARLATLAAALAAAPLLAHSQNVMNILNSLGGGLGSALTGGAAAPAAQGDDLISLLTQSMENIDEPKEIEIGRNYTFVVINDTVRQAVKRIQAIMVAEHCRRDKEDMINEVLEQ